MNHPPKSVQLLPPLFLRLPQGRLVLGHLSKLEPGTLFSRFPNMQDCCRKALFATLLGRLRALLPIDAPLNDGQYIPRQWALPRQAALLKEEHELNLAKAKASDNPRKKPIYIIKPDHGCQGGDGCASAAEEAQTHCCDSHPGEIGKYFYLLQRDPLLSSPVLSVVPWDASRGKLL